MDEKQSDRQEPPSGKPDARPFLKALTDLAARYIAERDALRETVTSSGQIEAVKADRIHELTFTISGVQHAILAVAQCGDQSGVANALSFDNIYQEKSDSQCISAAKSDEQLPSLEHSSLNISGHPVADNHRAFSISAHTDPLVDIDVRSIAPFETNKETPTKLLGCPFDSFPNDSPNVGAAAHIEDQDNDNDRSSACMPSTDEYLTSNGRTRQNNCCLTLIQEIVNEDQESTQTVKTAGAPSDINHHMSLKKKLRNHNKPVHQATSLTSPKAQGHIFATPRDNEAASESLSLVLLDGNEIFHHDERPSNQHHGATEPRETTVESAFIVFCPRFMDDDDVAVQTYQEYLIYDHVDTTLYRLDYDPVLLVQELQKALSRRLRSYIIIEDAIICTSGRILLKVNEDTKLQILQDSFNLVTTYFDEFVRHSRRASRPFPVVELSNILPGWNLHYTCCGLDRYFVYKFENFPFEEIQTQIHAYEEMGNVVERTNPNTAPGTSFKLYITWELYDLIGGYWEVYSHRRKLVFKPYTMKRCFCSLCGKDTFHTEEKCSGPPPPKNPSIARLEQEKKRPNLKCHSMVLKLKPYKGRKKKQSTTNQSTLMRTRSKKSKKN